MDVDNISFLEWAFKGAVTVLFTVGGWLWVMLVKAVKETKDDLNQHKLNVAENYATKSDVNATMGDIKDTMKRVHERIDGIFDLLSKGQR